MPLKYTCSDEPADKVGRAQTAQTVDRTELGRYSHQSPPALP
jgi:hypothetical protein